MKWSFPVPDELEAAQELIDEFLERELAGIRDFISTTTGGNGKEDFTKEQLQNRLTVICGIIVGAGYCMPEIEAPLKPLIESSCKLLPLKFQVHVEPPKMTLKVCFFSLKFYMFYMMLFADFSDKIASPNGPFLR